MTEQEKEEQRRSFVYGNLRIGNDLITKEMVDRVADREMADSAADGLRYGEWIVAPEYRDIVPCGCVLASPCGCVDADQRAWALDMDSDFGDSESGVECLACGATWNDGE